MPEITEPLLDQPHTIELPSKGSPYEGPNGPLLPDGRVTVRPMRGDDEAVLASNLNWVERLSRLVASCATLPPGLSETQLLNADLLALLTAIRVVTYGSLIPMDVECPYCRHKFAHTINLAKDTVVESLPREVKGTQYTYSARKGINVTLPASKKPCVVRLLTVADEIKILHARPNDYPEFTRKNTSWYLRRAYSIAAHNGNVITHGVHPELVAVLTLIRDMHTRDLAQIEAAQARHSPSFEIVGRTPCPACKEEVAIPVGTTPEFFRSAEVDAG